MQDLTGKFIQALSPSSMSAGNTTADDRRLTMSAPGSPSVLPVPDRMDNLPMPEFTNAEAIDFPRATLDAYTGPPAGGWTAAGG